MPSSWFSDDYCNEPMRKTRLNSLVLAKVISVYSVNRYEVPSLEYQASALQVSIVALLEAMNMPAFVFSSSFWYFNGGCGN